MDYVNCNLCGADDTKFLFKLNVSGYNVVECRKCGLIYINPRSSSEGYQKIYSDSYFKNPVGTNIGYIDYVSEKDIHLMNAEKRLCSIGRYQKLGRILDVGCATGFFLDAAKEKGWQTYGVEISEWACSHANRSGLNVFCGRLSDADFNKNFFDVVVLYGTIEHMMNPLEELSVVNRVVKPGGLIVVSTEVVDCFLANLQGRYYPAFRREEHTYFFKKDVMIKMLNKAGFRVIEVRDEGTLMPVKYLIRRLREYESIPFVTSILDVLEYLVNRLHLDNRMINLRYGYLNFYAKKIGDNEKDK